MAGARRNALAQCLENIGYDVLVSDGGADTAAQFVTSGASICIIDLDGDNMVGLDALTGAATLQRAATLVLSEPTDPALDRIIAGGATHYLPRPFAEPDLMRALQLADRHVERLRGRRERRVPRGPSFAVESDVGARERIAARLAQTVAAPTLSLSVHPGDSSSDRAGKIAGIPADLSPCNYNLEMPF